MPAELRYRAVLFDLDGTLVDSYGALAEAVNFARAKFGLARLTTETIREFVGEGLERLLCRAFDTDVVPDGATEAFETRYGRDLLRAVARPRRRRTHAGGSRSTRRDDGGLHEQADRVLAEDSGVSRAGAFLL